jgi:DNA-binding transcriptional LysR family regulator
MDLRILRYFVTVVEERHVGRAAARLQMTQPPLSRAIRQLEAELKANLFDRTPRGVTPTAAGMTLYNESRALLDQAERIRVQVAAAAGVPTLTLGVLGDSAVEVPKLAAEFRKGHPDAIVHVREGDLTDPTTGLRAGLVDVALTREPFDTRGITVRRLRADAMGVVVRVDDSLAAQPSIQLGDLAGRRWFRFPDGTDPLWANFWRAGQPVDADAPVVRTIHECIQAILWNDSVGLAPITGQGPPDGLTVVPVSDMPPSRLVLAWSTTSSNPLARSFARVTIALYRGGGDRTRPVPRGVARPTRGRP